MRHFRPVALTPPLTLDPAIAIAASRAGALGVLDLSMIEDVAAARRAIERMVRFAERDCGVLVQANQLDAFSSLLGSMGPAVSTVIVSAGEGTDELGPRVDALRRADREVWLEVTGVEQARAGELAGVDALVAKGQESGGWVGEETTFILVQRLVAETSLQVYARGGIGLHTAAAVSATGAAGAVLDVQLWLTRESRLPERVKTAIASMDGSETVTVGMELGAGFRLYTRPHLPAASELARTALELSGSQADSASCRVEWRRTVDRRVDWETADGVWPIGQDAAFASELSRRCVNVAGVLRAIRDSVDEHIAAAGELAPLGEGAPLAESHGTRFPIVQGPMTRVSDTAQFAAAVAEGGGLPFLALALMRGPEAESLLKETKERLGDRPWGVGVLGFVPLELRQEQLEVVQRYKPPFALIAGGRPDQAKRLDDVGIATYLHVPSPGLLKLFLQDGARRFVFEGRECGGHVGPRSSFVLWESMIEVLLAELDEADAAECHVLFAGGIHDARSSSMVAAMAAPLARKGVKVGALLGTSYLFTEEAVSAGAIGSVFQQRALACEQTVLVESGPGHAVRCVPNPFTEEFESAKQRLHAEGKSAEEIRHELEALNIGRLRVASKGLKRNPDYGASGAPKLVTVDTAEQVHDGMFMIGQLASLRSELTTVEALHRAVSVDGTLRLRERTMVEPRAVDVGPAPSRIAIVGMSCVMPKAGNLVQYWDNIVNKVYALDEIPADRWDWRDYFDEDRAAPDRIYSRWGGFLDEVEFDPLEFGMPPNSLPSIDPMQLIALVVARDALKDAGYDTRPFDRQGTSVILGASGGTGDLGSSYNIRTSLPMLFGKEAADRIVSGQEGLLPEWTEDSFAGLLPNVAAGRIANRFDLGGFNYVVDSACASSLTAIHLAVQELESRSTNMVIAGGIDTVNTPFGYMCFSKTQALSPLGKPRTFDANADGITISEGIAMVVLKRLEDAERDGDRIYAVIQAVGGSSDGKAKGLTAPRPEGQELALERAYRKAGFPAQTVELFEAHGTGTVVGDRTEALSLTTYLEREGSNRARHAVGSVKSMIGHTKATAGVAGLAKVALALYHKVLPPTLGVTTPNPKARFGDGPLYVNSETRPWIRGVGEHPRRAGVSAFGFGGTNFHAVLEEYTGDILERPAVSSRMPSELFLWSRPSRAELVAAVEDLARALEDGAQPELHDLAYTLAAEFEAGWAEANVQLAIVAASREDLVEKLDRARASLSKGGDVSDPKGIHFAEKPLGRDGKVAVLFSGQGSQYPDMLLDLALHFDVVRERFELADRMLADRYGRPLSEFVFPPPAFTQKQRAAQQEELKQTNVAQPALGAADTAIFRLLERTGVPADMLAGHSYGEYVALHAAGVFDEETLARVSEVRGRSIIEAAERELGSMIAVAGGAREVEKALDGLEDAWIANLNAPKQTIVSGTKEGLERAAERLEAAGLSSRPIPVACAFHSPLVAPAQERLAAYLAECRFEPPTTAVYSNTTGATYPSEPKEISGLLARHLTNPVRFADEIEAMYAAGARIFVEAGPKTVLTGLARSVLTGRAHLAVATDQPGRSGVTQLHDCLGQLAAHGLRLSPTRLYEGRRVHRLEMKTLVASTRPDAPKPTTWLVDGKRARPHGKPLAATKRPQLPAGGPPATASPQAPRVAAAETARAAGPQSAPAPAGRPPAALPAAASDPGVDQVMLRFQDLMGKFLETQGRVMSSYLHGGAPVPDAGAWEPSAGVAVTPMPVEPPGPEDAAPAPAAQEAAVAPEPVAPAPEAVAPAATEDHLPTREELTQELLRIVGERTGYPPEMLDLGADVEAELGIDSIKRIEIISALQRTFMPDGQQQDPEAMEQLTAVKTLGGVVDWISKSVDNVRHIAEADSGAGSAAAPADTAAPTRDELTQALLNIVAERTGYPAEMLDLNADVEAELGVDSIKRVEIIGALRREFFADEAEQDPVAMEELTAVKSLGGIVEWIVATIDHAAGRPHSPDGSSPAMPEPARSATAAETTPVAAAGPEPAPVVSTGDLPRLRFDVRESPLGELAEPKLDSRRVVIVTDDERGVAADIAARLGQQSVPVATVRHGGSMRIVRPGAYEADLADEGSIDELVRAVRREQGPIGSILHLLPLRDGRGRAPSGEDDLARWKRTLREESRSLFLLARAAAPDLGKSDDHKAAVIAAASLDGTWGLAADVDRSAAGSLAVSHGALAGLVKTIAIEWPATRCRVIDFDAETKEAEIADSLMREWAGDEDAVQVGYRAGRRLTFTAERAPLDESASPRISIDGDSVVLLTGGARGITAEVAIHLAERCRPTLVLVGRSVLPEGDEPPETAALESPQQIKPYLIAKMKEAGEEVSVARIEAACNKLLKDREVRSNLQRMRAAGATVRYARVDTRDEEAMRQLVRSIHAEHGRLDGVIHGAGLIEDKLLAEKEPASFDRVFDTKADSAFVLARVLDPESLRFLVLFSSAAAAYGNRGQADYAAANEVLNKLAIALDAEWPGRVVSIGWGPWATTGMVSEELQKQFAERGIELIAIPTGCQALERELQFGRKGEASIVLAGGAWGDGPRPESGRREGADAPSAGLPMLVSASSKRHGNTVDVVRTMDPAADVCLMDHQLDGNPVVPMALALETMAEVAQQGWPDLHVTAVRDLRVLKGIVIDGAPKAIRVTARAQADPPFDRVGANVDVEISSVDDNQRHYRATVELSDRMPDPPRFSTADHDALPPFTMPLEQAFDSWLFHGPLFLGIEEVTGLGKNHVGSRVRPSVPAECVAGHPPGQWLIDPVVVDSGLQLVIFWSRAHFDMTPLPSRFERYRRFGSLDVPDLRCFVEARASMGGHSILTSLSFVDRDGRLLGVLEDLEASGSRELNRLAAARGA